MAFTDEIKAYKAQDNKEAIAAQAAQAVEKQAVEDPFAFNEALPRGADPVVPAPEPMPEPVAAEATNEEPAAVEAKKEEKKPVAVKIGKQEFASVDEAIEYAKELERQAAEDKAYVEGLKAAEAKVVEAPKEMEEPLKKKIADKLFENPEEGIDTLIETIKKEIREEYNKSLQEAARAKAAADAKQAAWDSFYQQNTDLSSPETRGILENYLLPKLTNEGLLTAADGFDKFADIARKHLKIVKEQAAPTKELPSGPAPTLGTTTSDTSKKAMENSDGPVDFITALKKIRAGSKH